MDFGFVVIPTPVEPTTPAPAPASTTPVVPATSVPTSAPTTPATTDELSNTGFDGAVLMAMGLLLTMLGGGAVVLTGRRRRASTTRH
ncbi:hypothetical protein AS189_07350 [Arthrobacter alpinus]|uniref:Gram-positive cocci surface proteins LPxTG domain-containing protein n=1 Tax=Arthrobacter alpinus TaxID=656366 RepID=A0A0S2LXW7_9MICC|nr:LPXTG cell wall anchor domain-containing protein [Arthrobacter alpinus]ALO66341.1 hypothetical protein AS189_07350 [Arthrobacter alpinus]